METPTFTKPVYCYRVVEVVKVVDGDTCDVLLDVGFHTYLRKRLRFLGIDTWEVRGDEREHDRRTDDRDERGGNQPAHTTEPERHQVDPP